MFESKPKPPAGPNLLDRIVASDCRRIAIVGLHPGAGARTVVAVLVRLIHERAWPFAIAAVPGLALEQDDVAPIRTITSIAVPAGAIVATAESTIADSTAELDIVEHTPWTAPLGPIGIWRVTKAGETALHGPTESDAARAVFSRLAEISGGLVLVEGGWERRAFAAPGVCDGVVLVVAAGYSKSVERSAAAARYLVEILSAPPCDEPARAAWQETASRGAAALLDGAGRPLGVLPPGLEDPVPAMKSADGVPVATVVLPFGLNDDFMIPLVRSQVRCALVVRDATRINVSPVYFKAWLKGGGRIEAVHPTKLVAVATNPVNVAGPDADPAEFRRTVAEAVPELPVHDVVLESDVVPRKPLWKFWD